MSSVASVGHNESVSVHPQSVHIGAEIRGVDLAQPLADETVAEITAALLKWKVVFFRDQHLDHDSHIRFARAFGKPTPGHVVLGNEGTHPEIYSIAKYRAATEGPPGVKRSWTGWHTDITAAVNPPYASILRGVTVPPYGGDTQWTNLAAAYRALSPKLRGFLDTLRVVHAFESRSESFNNQVKANRLEAEHPLVTIHAGTGERVLYVSPVFAKSIVDLTPTESEALLEQLWEHAVRPEFTVRFKWEPGSVAFWDNRATSHLAPSDIFDIDFDRQFYRVTLLGDVPVGVDGSASTLLSGKPIGAV